MNYRKSKPYPSKYHGRAIKPRFFVLHTTEGGSKAWLDSAFSGTDPNYHYSVHWVAYKDGEVVEYLPWKRDAVAGWHAGTSEWKGTTSLNYHSIGVEIQHRAGDTYPRAQVEALKDLLRMVKAEWPNLEIVKHSDIAMPRGRKSDPTRPWKDIEAEVLSAWEEDEMSKETEEEEDEMSKETEERLLASAQASSYREAITNALLVDDLEAVVRLNAAFYERFPKGESGLSEDWTPPK